MRRPSNGFIAVAVACTALLSGASALAALRAPTPLTDESRVLAADDAFAAAEVKRDESTLRRLVDDKFRLNRTQGSTLGKEELIQEILKMPMVGQSLSERTVLVEGNVAFVFGTAELHLVPPERAPSVSMLRYTAAYVNRQGQWRLLALQLQRHAPPQ